MIASQLFLSILGKESADCKLIPDTVQQLHAELFQYTYLYNFC